jgi:hypothetical protein
MRMVLDGIVSTVRIGLVTGLNDKIGHCGGHMAKGIVLSISLEKN